VGVARRGRNEGNGRVSAGHEAELMTGFLAAALRGGRGGGLG